MSTAELDAGARRSHAHSFVPDIIRDSNLNLGKVFLNLLLHHVLYEDPAFTLKLAVSAVHDTQDTLAQGLLHLPHQAPDLVDKLDFYVITKTTVGLRMCVAVKL